MKDFIAAGTGNSRYLKSSISDDTTWAQALEMLRNGTFPIDLNGINPAGVTQQGTPLNKANLLSDESAALFGLDSNAVINDVWELLSTSGTLSTILVTTEADSRVTATKGDIVKYGTQVNDVYLIRGITPGSWTVTAEKGTDTASQLVVVSDPQQYSVNLVYPRVYGVSWRFGTSSQMTRTDDAAAFSDPQPYVLGASTVFSPFDNIMPWAGMVRVTDETCGELVAIPKFWYKLEYIVEEQNGVETNVGIDIKISPTAQAGFHISPAHMPRTSSDVERDIVYVGRYKCGSDFKSKTDTVAMQYETSVDSSVASVESGKTFVFDYATWFTILLLYLVEYANWDSQNCIGYGSGDGTYAGAVSKKTGYTDLMPYHTGTMKESKSTYGPGTQYRYVEGLWDMCGEIIASAALNHQSGFSKYMRLAGRYDSGTENTYDEITAIADTPSGYVDSLALSDAWIPLFYPDSTGNDVAGTCDYFDTYAPIETYKKYCICGSDGYDGTQKAGIIGLVGREFSAGGSSPFTKFRLIKLP